MNCDDGAGTRIGPTVARVIGLIAPVMRSRAMVALKPEIEPDAANHLSAVQSWIQHALCNNLGLEVADASAGAATNVR